MSLVCSLVACGTTESSLSAADTLASALDEALGVDTTETPEKRGCGFSKRDTNGDGFITSDEVSAEEWTRLSVADADADGQLTQAEIEAAIEAGTLEKPKGGRHGPRGPSGPSGEHGPKGDPFTRDDKNADGFITEDEVPADLWLWLVQADADANAQVSRDEIDAAKAAGTLPEPPKPPEGRGGHRGPPPGEGE
jgi:hypothetical protein